MSNIHSEITLSSRFFQSAIFIHRCLFKRSVLFESLRKKNIKAIVDKLQSNLASNGLNSGKTLSVDRRSDLSDKDFVREYLNKGLPVIFSQEASSWPCSKKWGLDYLMNQFPDDEFSLIDSTGLVEKAFDRSNDSPTPALIDKVKSKEFVQRVRSGDKAYLRFCPIMETHPELESDLDLGWLKKFRRCFLGISYQTFIGPAGRKTPLHSETTAFFYIMADGEKDWTLFSPTAFPIINPEPEGRGYNFSRVDITHPDLEKYPGINLITRYTCRLKKGDILFVPAWMWHEVTNVTEGWGISYRFTSLRGFLRHPLFVFVRLFLTKPSFLEILYYSFFRSDITSRKNNLLTPKIYLKK
jgi:hypothetical protein